MIKALPIALCVLAAGCADLPSGDLESPYTWGDHFLDKYADELAYASENIEPGPEPLDEPRTILLITGVTIPAEWFDPIVARLERDGFRPVVWEPPALLSGSLLEASHQLADVIDELRAETGQDTIDILAECTGGVIARYYLHTLGGDQYVDRMVTFVSPQSGLPKAAMAYSIARWPALRDLTPGSAFLTALHSRPIPAGVDVTSIYTCHDEYIQPWQGSAIPGANNVLLCDAANPVVHFQTFFDPDVYLIMHAALVN